MPKFTTICASAALLSFLAGAAFAAPPPNTVKVLLSSFIKTTSAGATVTVTKSVGPFTTDALVFTSANGITTPTAGTNAGAVTRIKKDGVPIASDDSFDNVAPNFPQEMNAARQFVLRKNIQTTISAEVDPTGTNGANNTQSTIELRVDAIQTCRAGTLGC
jgi:hypothetical protein